MPKKHKVDDATKVKIGQPTYVRAKTGAAMYEMGVASFKALGREAEAVYRYKNFVMYNTKKIDQYLEYFREDS